MVLTTNWQYTAYHPVLCPLCSHPHHYTAEDHYRVAYDVVVTNFVDHPSVHKTPPMKDEMFRLRLKQVDSSKTNIIAVDPLPLPPLPPPTVSFRRSNTNGLPADQIQR